MRLSRAVEYQTTPKAVARGEIPQQTWTPIIQAPIDGVSTQEIAAAVSNAGGLGSIGAGSVDAEITRQMIVSTRSKTDRPFNVNVFCHQPAVADTAKEAGWLARLAPAFKRYGAESPGRMTEIYQSLPPTAQPRWADFVVSP